MNAKAAASRYQRQLAEVSRQPGNDVCADCGGRNPRWASHNLGIFLCVQCAGVHRKMGTHISKVKSLTLDDWKKEEVDRMKEYGNVRSNAYYNPNDKRNRAPANVGDGERDSEVERFIRSKYEFRRFIDRRPPPLPQKDSFSSDGRPSFSGPTASSSGSSTARTIAVGGGRGGGAAAAAAAGGWGAASSYSPVEMRDGFLTMHPPTTSSSSRGNELDSSAQGRDIHRSRTAPIPTTWKEAKRAVSPLPALPNSKSPAAPIIAASSHSARASNMPYANGQTSSPSFSHLPSSTSNANGSLSVNGNGQSNGYPSLPQRASSAQAVSQHSTNGHSAVGLSSSPSYLYSDQSKLSARPPPPMTSQSFSGRSAVFDDLLELTQPVAPVSQIYGAYGGGGGGIGMVGNTWSGMQATGSGMNGTNASTGPGMNPWAQQQQPQPAINGMMSQATGSNQASYFQQQQQQQQQPGNGMLGQGQTSGPHLSPQNLGGLAFAPQLYQHQVQQQPQYQNQQKQQQQQQQQQLPQAFLHPNTPSSPGLGGMIGATPSGGTNPFGLYQQQYQQPLQPPDTADLMGRQREQKGQVFLDWTSRMMPSHQQQ